MNGNTSLSTAAASGSVAMSIAVILEWLLSFANISMTPDVQTALATVLTAAVHYYLTKPRCPKCPSKPQTSTDAPPAEAEHIG